ncbi:MAG: 3-deoxy-manno-octulosonate cytidylyltransferase [Rikenellaceae bacterium]|nr:3-deoxy-manno-octulosonate cytidylyltransferase [Rikenellaceae bacterium]
MKFLSIIPARYASTRFPGKPLAQILGKPMIQWVYERTSAHFADTWVATDDQRIYNAVEAFGGRVVMTSDSHRSGTDRIAEALETIERITDTHYDVVINVQGDEPLIAGDHLQTIAALFDQPSTQIGTLVKPFAQGEDIFNPNSPKVVMTADNRALYFSRSVIPHLRGAEPESWQTQHTYYKHIGMYAYRAEVLREITRLPQSPLELAESLEQLRWLENGYTVRVGVTSVETISVDTPEDLEKLCASLQ